MPCGDRTRGYVERFCGRLALAACVLTSTVVLPNVCRGAAGDLDASFGNGGVVLTNFDPNPVPGPSSEQGHSVAVQADGKILVAGSSGNGVSKFALARYDPDGSLDTSFAGTGIATTVIGSSGGYGASVAVQADGKIVVAGYSRNGSDYDFALARYNVDGSLDASFSGDGITTTEIGTSNDYAFGVAVQADGKILVTGSSFSGNNSQFALARYNADGSLDTAFSNDGILTTTIGGSFDYAYGVAVQADGRILVAGSSFNGSNDDFALARYNADGSLDTTFAGDGIATTVVGEFEDAGRSLAVQADGRILVAGSASTSGTSQFALARYNTDGSLDTTFSGDGTSTTAIGADAVGYSCVVQPDGRILVAGASNNGSDVDFAVARYNIDGSLDTTFSSDGTTTTAIGAIHDFGQSVAVQDDGRIVVAGYSNNSGNDDIALARYDADGNLDTSFSDDGITATHAGGSSGDVGSCIAVQTDGNILVAGYSYNGSSNHFALARYGSDGAPDTTFSDGGVTTTAVGNDAIGSGVAVQADGRILVAGSASTEGSYQFALVRYDTDGALDATFSGDGITTTAIGNYATGSGVAIQADGKILVAGTSSGPGKSRVTLARYNTDGSLDASFAGGGVATASIGNTSDIATSVAVQADGKILVAGYSNNGSNNDFALARFNANGSLDTSFSGDGKLTTAIGSSDEYAHGVALQVDDRILVGGYAWNGSTFDIALVRYNTNGSLDTSFSGDGITTTDIDSSADIFRSLAVQADGKILVAGYTHAGRDNRDFALARYNSDGSLDTSFSGDGIAIAAIGNSDDYGMSVGVQADGRILVAGYAVGDDSYDFALARLDAESLPGNTAPAFAGHSFSTPKDLGATVWLTEILSHASDADGDTLTVSSVGTPSTAGGTVSLSGAAVSYSPPSGYTGADGFSITMEDGRGGSVVGTVAVTVIPPGAFAEWMDTHSESDPLDNFGGTGINQLLTYIFGADLTTTPRDALPTCGVAEFAVGNGIETFFTFRYRFRSDATDASIAVEFSGDLETWLDVTAQLVLVGIADNGDGTSTITLRESTPIDPAAPGGRYYRARGTVSE